MKYFLFLTVSVLVASCVIIPIPTEKVVLEGRRLDDSRLNFVEVNRTTRSEVIDKLGRPTIWFPRQRILVYGLRQVDAGYWVIFMYGTDLSVESEKKEAVFFALDENEMVTHWGQSVLKDCETWLSGAIAWAKSENISIQQPLAQFTQEVKDLEEGTVYFFWTQDAKYIPSFLKAEYVQVIDLTDSATLLGEVQKQSYVVRKVSPGRRYLQVNPDTDCVNSPESYNAATIILDILPGSVHFVDIDMKIHHGRKPVLTEQKKDEAIQILMQLKESW